MVHDLTRDERAHWVGQGSLLTVSALEHLTPIEFSEVPDGAAELLEHCRERLAAMPASLSFAHEDLRGRPPLLERAQFDDRIYWTVRLAGWGNASSLEHPCLGGTGERLGATDLPQPLGWLASTFGHATLVAEQSGTAPFGRPLRDFLANQELLLEAPPDGSEDWVALYEADGDAIFADLESGAAYWLGHEWTGDEVTPLPVPWPTVAIFVVWRMLDGGYVRRSRLRRSSSDWIEGRSDGGHDGAGAMATGRDEAVAGGSVLGFNAEARKHRRAGGMVRGRRSSSWRRFAAEGRVEGAEERRARWRRAAVRPSLARRRSGSTRKRGSTEGQAGWCAAGVRRAGGGSRRKGGWKARKGGRRERDGPAPERSLACRRPGFAEAFALRPVRRREPRRLGQHPWAGIDGWLVRSPSSRSRSPSSRVGGRTRSTVGRRTRGPTRAWTPGTTPDAKCLGVCWEETRPIRVPEGGPCPTDDALFTHTC